VKAKVHTSTGSSALTPLMRQYVSVKAEHEDCILLFRMGDFWETFYGDASVLSEVLGIALTSRGVENGEPVPLAGIPLQSLEPAVAKLVRAGHRVAICDQVEDPKMAKGLVRREVVEVVSAGTATLPGLLDEKRSRFLVSLTADEEAGRVGIARCDVTTGEFVASELPARGLADELDRIGAAELLLPAGDLPAELREAVASGLPVERLAPSAYLAPTDALERVRQGPGLAAPRGQAPLFLPLATVAAAALLGYLGELKKAERDELMPLELAEGDDGLVLDEISLRNLEILRPLREGASGATLLERCDRTRTPMGARLLREWLSRPLVSPVRIAARHDAIVELLADPELRADLVERLSGRGDIARIAMRVAAGRAHGRDLVALANCLADMPQLRESLRARESEQLRELADAISDFTPEVESIRETLVSEPPLSVREGGLIREGRDAELDRLRGLSHSGKSWIAALQAQERERTGISNLRVGYNRVFGYYIEVTKANHDLVPSDYERRQTLVNAERFITPALKEREAEILGSEERSRTLEYDLFVALRERLAPACPRIRRAGQALAALDVLVGFAELAAAEGWVRPLIDDTDHLEILGGRHPVVEAALPANEFVPNDVHLDGSSRQILLVTGPNMAGKSTYLRQVALIVILAQTGCFVPASQARIGVVDRVFTRVGAADSVASGQSTFMVEMVEVSRILAATSPRSLVLLDEVGRGTSTYDGLAIAWAVTEYLHEHPERAARTLFATHYHELSDLVDRLPRARNLRVTVHEWKDEVVFLRKVVEGAADRSFGIQVARLAGLPAEVTQRAREILAGLEDGTFFATRERRGAAKGDQLDLFSSEAASVLAELTALDPETMTPLEALAVLSEWRRRLSGGKDA
jgi:DNA mismatch repair protein MutS